jgi:hypothetical protein
MKKRFYCLLAAVLMAGACICVPVAEAKAEDGYNIDSYDNDDWYDSDDSPTDMVLDLSNVTIDKTSQPKRMQEKFYDCSSLVWKSYHKNGVNFGMANYAPVAADMGKWCAQHKKLVSGGLSQANIQNMKLNPGDVMFETGQKNGRYKGIYHVEMITGYLFYGFDGNGKAELGIQWAAGDEKYYPMGQMVGRP